MNREPIYLSEEQRQELEVFKKSGCKSVALVKRAKVILQLDRNNKKDHLRVMRICERTELSKQSIYNIWDDFNESESIAEFLTRKKRETPPVEAKITGDVEAHIIALACSEPPQGCARWTVRLLAKKAVELEFIDSISFKSVQRILKKRNISLI